MRNEDFSTGDLPKHLLEDNAAAAVYSNAEKNVLFVSRARETHREQAHVDLAVQGGDANRPRQRLWSIPQLCYNPRNASRSDLTASVNAPS